MTNLKTKISRLQPGEAVEISRTAAAFCTVERSGDGRTLRFVRHAGNTQAVFLTCLF